MKPRRKLGPPSAGRPADNDAKHVAALKAREDAKTVKGFRYTPGKAP